MTKSSRNAEHPWVQRSRPRGGRPLIFAHRGGAGLAPENTWPAFEGAHALGVDGFELDVQVSREGEVLVMHDLDLGRTTDQQGRVSAMSADELLRADAGYRFSLNGEHPFRGKGVRIPRLRDLLAHFRDTLFIIELKGDARFLSVRAIEVVREAKAFDRVCFGAFSMRHMYRVRRLGSQILPYRPDWLCTSASALETRVALYASWVHCPFFWVGNRTFYYNYFQAFQVPEMAGSTRVVSPQFIQAAHAAGLLVQVWTVNEEADMRRLADMGVDGLITDRPDRARSLWPAPPRASAAESAPVPEPSSAAAAASRPSGTAAR
jgi:glycerophosphoryl diester phosphodiesterase